MASSTMCSTMRVTSLRRGALEGIAAGRAAPPVAVAQARACQGCHLTASAGQEAASDLAGYQKRTGRGLSQL